MYAPLPARPAGVLRSAWKIESHNAEIEDDLAGPAGSRRHRFAISVIPHRIPMAVPSLSSPDGRRRSSCRSLDLVSAVATVLRRALDKPRWLDSASSARQGGKAEVRAQSKCTSKNCFPVEDGKREEVITSAPAGSATGGKFVARKSYRARLGASLVFSRATRCSAPADAGLSFANGQRLRRPAKSAYFAQSEVLYRKLLGSMPVLLPRADYTLVDPKLSASPISTEGGGRLAQITDPSEKCIHKRAQKTGAFV